MVVFPAPFGPRIQEICSEGQEKLTSLRATVSFGRRQGTGEGVRYIFEILRTEIVSTNLDYRYTIGIFGLSINDVAQHCQDIIVVHDLSFMM
jgi:hypothetical protein